MREHRKNIKKYLYYQISLKYIYTNQTNKKIIYYLYTN